MHFWGTQCTSRFSLTRIIRCHWLSLVAIRCHLLPSPCQSFSLVVTCFHASMVMLKKQFLISILKNCCLKPRAYSGPTKTSVCFFFAKIIKGFQLHHKFFLFVSFAKFYIVFYYSYINIARTCRRRLSYDQALICKYLHLQYNAFIIYNASKQSFRDHPTIRCLENTQETDWRTPLWN